MHIKDKLNMDVDGLWEHGHINIAVFGDSITHGAVGNGIDYDLVWWNRLRRRLNAYRDYVPVNIINGGIGGSNAAQSVSRLERDALCHHPDLVIICFGLNDAYSDLGDFTQALDTMFRTCLNRGADVIFMTPNMLNTYVAPDTPPEHMELAAITADLQNNGRMDSFMDAARETARKAGVPVCDCYAVWKQMERDGTDTTLLLGNRINHPDGEMHKLFADMLYDMIMDEASAAESASSTMYRGN